MFLEELFLENNTIDEDTDLDLFSEALSFGKKKEPELTKKQKVAKAVKDASQKKSVRIAGVIAGGLIIAGAIYMIAKKIKESKAVKSGEVNAKDVDEKVKITKKIEAKLKQLRAAISKEARQARKAEREAKKRLKDKGYSREDLGYLKKNYGSYKDASASIGSEAFDGMVKEAQKSVSLLKRILNFMTKKANNVGAKVDDILKRVKGAGKTVQESTNLFENEDYKFAFESAVYDDVDMFECKVEDMLLDTYIESYILDDVMESFSDDEESDDDDEF